MVDTDLLAAVAAAAYGNQRLDATVGQIADVLDVRYVDDLEAPLREALENGHLNYDGPMDIDHVYGTRAPILGTSKTGEDGKWSVTPEGLFELFRR